MIEPMIEPIFVILGILASVAIPRLAATREDAEISAAVANLRTLVSDASAYYTVKGTLGAGNTAAKWKDLTNVPLSNDGVVATNATAGATLASLKVGGKECINVRLAEKGTTTAGATTPAHIKIAKNSANKGNGVCAKVLASDPIKAYFIGANGKVADAGTIAIGSNTNIYTTTP